MKEYRFDVGVNSVFPNPLGTRLVFIDETHAAYVYNPVDDAVIGIEKFAGSADRIMWDVAGNLRSSELILCRSKHFCS